MPGPPKPLALVLASLLLAVVGDLLLQGAAWGVNVGLLALSVVVVVLSLARRSPMRLSASAKALAALVVVFALLYSLRDSNALKTANGVAIFFCLGALVLPVSEGGLKEAHLSKLLLGPWLELFRLPTRLTLLAHDARDQKQASPTTRRQGAAIARGLLLAAPLLLVFGVLFASADPVFRAKIESLFRLDLDLQAINGHFWTLLFGVVLAAGLLCRLFRHDPASGVAPPAPAKPGSHFGITEIGIVLGLLNLLFAAFLAVQFRYLFGARDVVRVTDGLSFAEYARGGFFELVWVAALALVVLLGADGLLQKGERRDEAIYAWLGRVLVLMVFCVVASALTRMKLYTDAFGLTELRIYSTVFMGWLTLSFVWLLATTLRGRPRRFAFGMLAAGLLTIFCTNLANPEDLIVRTNLAKPQADFAYLETLSDDAVLALRELKDRIPAAHRPQASALIGRRRKALRKADWRESNLTRLRLAR